MPSFILRVSKLSSKIKAKFRDCDAYTRTLAASLAEQLEFMDDTLSELRADVAENGAVTTAVNGNGFKTRQENPAAKQYNTMIRNYNALLTTLAKLGTDNTGESGSELMEFLGGKKK